MLSTKYRKKPVVVEAVRFNGSPQWFEVTEWLIAATKKAPSEVGSVNVRDGVAYIHTLEGTMIANAGDYIIQGVKGELYPCREDIFEATYDPA